MTFAVAFAHCEGHASERRKLGSENPRRGRASFISAKRASLCESRDLASERGRFGGAQDRWMLA